MSGHLDLFLLSSISGAARHDFTSAPSLASGSLTLPTLNSYPRLSRHLSSFLAGPFKLFRLKRSLLDWLSQSADSNWLDWALSHSIRSFSLGDASSYSFNLSLSLLKHVSFGHIKYRRPVQQRLFMTKCLGDSSILTLDSYSAYHNI